MQAVAVKTLLWGGGFNPIIPAVAAVPRIWSNEVLILDGWTPEELLDAHLFAFDPDSLVVIEGAVLHGRDLSRWRVLTTNELGLVERAAGADHFGLTVYDAARAFLSREIRRGDEVPVRIEQPKMPAEWRLLEAITFGIEPNDFDANLETAAPGGLVVDRPRIELDEYMTHLRPDALSVRRLSHYGITGNLEAQYYLMDAQNLEHIVDFLSMRSQGFNVVPVTLQVTNSGRFIEAIQTFQHPQVRASIFIAPGLPHNEFIVHVQRLGFANPWIHQRNFRTPIARGERAWAMAGVERHTSLLIEDGGVTVNLDEPWDGQFYEGFGGQLYANDVAVWWQDEKRLPPDVIPGGIATVWPRSTFYHLMHGRISSGGLTFYNHLEGEETFPLPDATTIVREHLVRQGWIAEPSAEGLRAAQSLSLIGGLRSGWWVAASDALDVLTSDQVDANGEIGLYELRAALRRRQLDSQRAENLTQSLLEMDVLELGLRFRCLNCTRSPWYSLEDIANVMTCTYCRGTVRPERHSMTTMTHAWTYRLKPPLDRPAYRSNLFGIFGAAGYFRMTRSDSMTLALGLDMKKNEERAEIDLTVLIHERGEPARLTPTTVFVEAKGLAQRFDADDIASFERILGDFPIATYVFSTLRGGIEEDEKVFIRAFAAAGAARHGVAILTRAELRRMPHVADDDHDYSRAIKFGVISEVCQVTRQRYLA
jgi:hypothetical protein